VQENFRGFTYHGGESLVATMALGRRDRKERREKEEKENGAAVDDEEVPDVTTEDEFEDVGRSAGRYARKGVYLDMDGDLDDAMS
jgi:hypothetical protein